MQTHRSIPSPLLALALSALAACGDQTPTSSFAPQRADVGTESFAGPVGTLTSWGRNNETQVSATPTGLFSAASAGAYHSVGIRSDGTLASWGADSHGQVSNTPTGTFKAVSAGGFFSVALRTNGTLVTWGYNNENQVTNTPSGTFRDVSAGWYHILALRTDGTLVSWGMDNFSQVTNTPATGTFNAVSASDGWSVAIRSDGTLVAWGVNNTNQASTPSGTFISVDAGSNHGTALRSNGTLASWGSNNWGETSSTPPGTHTAATAGLSFSLALRADGTIASWGVNDYGQVGGIPSGPFSAVDAGFAHGVAIGVAPYAVPTAPASLVGSRTTSTQVQLGWSDLSNDETSFQLQRRSRPVGGSWSSYSPHSTQAANVTAVSADPVAANTDYQYRIRACNSVGCSTPWINSNIVLAEVAPAAPSNLVATDASSAPSGRRIALTWTDGSNNETAFLIQRRSRTGGVGSFGGYATVNTVAANVTSWNYDTGVAANTQYQYRIKSMNSAGSSAYVVSGYVMLPP